MFYVTLALCKEIVTLAYIQRTEEYFHCYKLLCGLSFNAVRHLFPCMFVYIFLTMMAFSTACGTYWAISHSYQAAACLPALQRQLVDAFVLWSETLESILDFCIEFVLYLIYFNNLFLEIKRKLMEADRRNRLAYQVLRVETVMMPAIHLCPKLSTLKVDRILTRFKMCHISTVTAITPLL